MALRAFPPRDIPESEKDKEWYKQNIIAIMGSTLNGSYYTTRESMVENYNYFNGEYDMERFSGITSTLSSDKKDALPAIWLDFNSIRPKIYLLEGELIKRGFEVGVNAINKEAKSRRLEFKKNVVAQMYLRDVVANLKDEYDVDIPLAEELPDKIEELEDFVSSNYKDNHELIMEYIIRYNVEVYKWKFKRLRLFRDICVVARCFVKNEIRNGYPQWRVLNPINVVFDHNSDDDFLTDSTYFGEVHYMGNEDIIEKWNLNKKEIKELREKGKGDTLLWTGAVAGELGTIFLPYNELDNQTRALVFQAEWLDYKEVKVKVSYDSYGNEHIHYLDERKLNALKDKLKEIDKKANPDLYDKVKKEVSNYANNFKVSSKEGEAGAKIATRKIKTVRTAVLIGGNILKEYGELKNITRDFSNPSETTLSYHALLPNYVNHKNLSKVDELKGIQDFKNILMWKIQLEIAKSAGKGVVINEDMIPDKYKGAKTMYNLKAFGIIFSKSGTEGFPENKKAVEDFDMTLSETVSQILNVIIYLDSQMDRISGISDIRQGQIQTGQLVGVTQASLVQSSMITEVLFDLFSQFEERVFQKHADLIKILWAKKRDKFAPILGDLNMNFLESDVEVDMDDYATFVKVTPLLLRDEELIKGLVMDAWQSGGISHSEKLDLLDLIVHDDIKQAFNNLKRKAKKREQLQAQMRQAEQQAMMAQKMADIQKGATVARTEGEYSLEKQKMKGRQDLDKTMVKEQSKSRQQLEGQTFEMDKRTRDMYFEGLNKELDRRERVETKE